eukprot:TRINITY_DN20692_c0_g1_i2.p1 TRINITY_DN20692_c0_g1~~TRINITY_DN20692_c0_g1_i2.p1  ORF type:complete len:156 (-),score=65.52 TRINITY_DN20692_c0_g1_i2:726-1193(-)
MAGFLFRTPMSRMFGASTRTIAPSHPSFLSVRLFSDELPADVKAQIEEDITNHKLFVFMKGTPDMPACGFSKAVCQILTAVEVPFGSRNVMEDDGIREGVKKFSQWPTIPQVYLNGEFIGGCDIMLEMLRSGELMKVLEDAGLREPEVEGDAKKE